MASQNLVTNALGNAYNALDNFGRTANQFRPDAVVLDALGEAFGMRENTDFKGREKNSAGQYKTNFIERVFGITPQEVKSTRVEQIDRDYEEAKDKLKVNLGTGDDRRSQKQIVSDIKSLTAQDALLNEKGVDNTAIGIDRGVVVPMPEFRRKVLDAANQQKIEDDTATKNAEFNRKYGVPGVSRVTDDGAPVIGSPERGAARSAERFAGKSQAEIEGIVAAENAGKLRAAQQGAIDKSDSGQAAIRLTNQEIAQSQSAIKKNQFDMDFTLAQQAENTRRYNLEYARDDNRDKRNFAFEKHKYSTNRADNIRRDNQQLDLRMFELELQKEMSEDARQEKMINNLMGGLFSLGSLL